LEDQEKQKGRSMNRALQFTAAWSSRLLALAVMIVAVGEIVQVGLDVWEQRK
jgi:hypothetical protein